MCVLGMSILFQYSYFGCMCMCARIYVLVQGNAASSSCVLTVGKIPTSIACLSLLRELDLRQNQLTGAYTHTHTHTHTHSYTQLHVVDRRALMYTNIQLLPKV